MNIQRELDEFFDNHIPEYDIILKQKAQSLF
jgi:hypothetical protein